MQAAIHVEGIARGEGQVAGGQEGDRAADILGLEYADVELSANTHLKFDAAVLGKTSLGNVQTCHYL